MALDTLGEREQHREYVATADECAALASRFSVLAVENLRASAWLRRQGAAGAWARVKFSAHVVQSCVVTLEPVRAWVEEAFELAFVPYADPADPADEAGSSDVKDEAVGELAGEEQPAAVIDGVIDPGEVIAEYLSLAIDPYPRKKGVAMELPGVDKSGEEEAGPFAALKHWRGRA